MDLTTIFLVKVGMGLATMVLAYLAVRALESCFVLWRKIPKLSKGK
jgi:hypothetical protein